MARLRMKSWISVVARRSWSPFGVALVWLGTALTFAVPAQGQEEARVPLPESPSGIRLVLGPTFMKPLLDGGSGEVFEPAGEFRGGPGATVGIGYDRGPVGLTVLMEFAGLEVGEPRERNGIGMGRESATARGFAGLVHWSPRWSVRRWRTVATAGYARQQVGDVQLATDLLPSILQHATENGEPDAGEHVVSVSGGGARLGIGMERVLSGEYGLAGRLGILVEGSADLSILGTATAETRTGPLHTSRAALQDAGLSIVPRIAVLLRWSPRSASAR